MSDNDQRQMSRARGGDHRAFVALVESHDTRLRHLAYRIVGTRERMDDVLQRAYLKAYRSTGRLTATDTVESWLYRAVWTACLDDVRRAAQRTHRRRSRASTGSLHPPVDGLPGDPPVARALAVLAIEERAVLLLADGLRVPPVGVAAALDVPLGDLRGRVLDARAVLADTLDRLLAQPEAPAPEPAADAGPAVGEGEDRGETAGDAAGVEPETVGDAPADAGPAEAAPTPDDIGAEPDGLKAEPEGRGAVPDVAVDDTTEADPSPLAAPAEPGRLRDLGAPQHLPGFWARLGERLMIEQETPAAQGPDPERVQPVIAPTVDPGTARPAGDAANIDRLAKQARRTRGGRWGGRLRRLGVVIGVLLVVGGIVAIALQLGSNAKPPLETQGTLATTVVRRMVDRLSSIDALGATVIVTQGDAGADAVTWQLFRSSDGSYRAQAADARRETAFDASTGTAQDRVELRNDQGATVAASTTTNAAAGPPDPGPDPSVLPGDDVALAARVVRAASPRLAEERTLDGRKVWVIDAPLQSPADGGADALELVVDRDQLLPVSVTLTTDGRQVRRTVFEGTDPDVPVLPGAWAVGFQPGDEVTTNDAGFVSAEFVQAATLVGYEPLRPSYLPPGYTLVSTRVQAAGKIVSLRYQRGLEEVVVSTRPTRVPAGEPVPDPFNHDTAVPTEGWKVDGGPFRQMPATRTADTVDVPALWVGNGALVLSVWGDLTPAELERVASSVR